MDLVPCAHCATLGTCRNGQEGAGCSRCQAFWIGRGEKLESFSDRTGIVCSVCWGKGLAEPSNQKWQYRFPAMLALLIIVAAVFLLFLFDGKKEFDKVIVFVSTLVGSVTGYYFGGERKSHSISPPPKPIGRQSQPEPKTSPE